METFIDMTKTILISTRFI